MIRKALLALAVAAFILGSIPSVADAPLQQQKGDFTATGTSIPIFLQGDNSCSVTISGTYSGVVITPQVSSDYSLTLPGTYAPATTINGGTINTNGVYIGNIASQGLSAFQLSAVGPTTGDVHYVIACSPAITGPLVVTNVSATTAPTTYPTTAPTTTAVPTGTPMPTTFPTTAPTTIPTTTPGLPGSSSRLQPTAAGSFTLTSASATGCTVLETGVHYITSITNAANVANAQYPTLYDESSATCAAADQIFSPLLGAAQAIQWPGGYLVTNGLVYQLSGALTAGQNIKIQGN